MTEGRGTTCTCNANGSPWAHQHATLCPGFYEQVKGRSATPCLPECDGMAKFQHDRYSFGHAEDCPNDAGVTDQAADVTPPARESS